MEQFESSPHGPEDTVTRLLEDGSLAVPARIIPPPDTISEEARGLMTHARSIVSEFEDPSLELIADHFEQMHAAITAESSAIYPVAIRHEDIGGIRCVVVEPVRDTDSEIGRSVLVNLSGGGPFGGPSNQVEAIPIAHLANTTVIQPLHRRPPQFFFPDDVDDVVEVYRSLLEHHECRQIGVYGHSSGGCLTFQLVSMLIFHGLPVPGAVAAWGASGESGRITDSDRINHDLDNAARHIPFNRKKCTSVNGIDAKDPRFSPIYADLRQFPPALLAVGSREPALSGAALMHRALRRAGTPAELLVFEAMDHGFPYYPSLPETQELYEHTARFFTEQLE